MPKGAKPMKRSEMKRYFEAKLADAVLMARREPDPYRNGYYSALVATAQDLLGRDETDRILKKIWDSLGQDVR